MQRDIPLPLMSPFVFSNFRVKAKSCSEPFKPKKKYIYSRRVKYWLTEFSPNRGNANESKGREQQQHQQKISEEGRLRIVLTFLSNIVGQEAIERAEKTTISPCCFLFRFSPKGQYTR